MKAITPLKDLDLFQLNAMLKHIRLGKEHLRKHLDEKAFNDLLSLGYLNEEQENRIIADSQERFGNIALVINAILTGILGSWLGMAGFIGLNLGSLIELVFVLTLSMITCGWIGILSYKVTAAKGQEMVITKKLRLVELSIIREINKRKQLEMMKVADQINQSLGYIDNKFALDVSQQQQFREELISEIGAVKWYENVAKIIAETIFYRQDNLLSNILQSKLSAVLKNLKDMTHKLSFHQATFQFDDHAEERPYGFETLALDRSLTNASYVKVLTTPGVEVENIVPTRYRWIKKNILAIITGMMPTMCGSFGSMFVFLSGTPAVLRSLDIPEWVEFFTQSSTKVIGLCLAVVITAYYTYSYIHSNYKNYLRQKEVEKTEKLIAEENAKLLKITTKCNLLSRIRSHIEELKFVYSIFRVSAD